MRKGRPMWMCARCGRGFANRNQTHSCGRHQLSTHLEGRGPVERRLFRGLLAELRRHGPVRVLPEKTRIAFQVRMSFAAITIRNGYLRGHLVLADRHESACFLRIESISRRNHIHVFTARSTADLVALRPYIALAYAVGEQKHLER